MNRVKWGEFKIGDLFEKLNLKFKKKIFDKEKDVSKIKTNEFDLPLVNAKDGDNGIMYFGRSSDFEFAEMTIDIVNDGAISTGNVYPQPQRTGVLYNAYLIKPKFNISTGLLYFFSAAIKKSIKLKYGYENKASWNKVKMELIQLPITNNNQIDFEFMKSFIAELEAERIAELEAYLTAAGLKDYELTPQEQRALDEFEGHKFLCGQFKFKDVFDKVVQGRRLKKDDQIHGDIPFVMSGITNTGVVNYIANPVTVFPKNSITVDIFGNTFYRGYNFGAGDDTGVYWSDKQDYSKEVMLYFAASMNKSLKGKFDYGNKLRSSQSLNIKMHLPIKENELDRSLMATLISAIQKLVIKDVVLFSERKITAHKQVVQS